VVDVKALAGHPTCALPVFEDDAVVEYQSHAVGTGGLAAPLHVPFSDPEIELAIFRLRATEIDLRLRVRFRFLRLGFGGEAEGAAGSDLQKWQETFLQATR